MTYGCRSDAQQTSPASAPPSPPTPAVPSASRAAPQPAAKPVEPQIDIHRAKGVIVTSRGELKIEFFAEDAPKTAENFIRLAQKGFYNGLRFHRVEPGTLIQGGDPTGTGAGGAGWTIPFEANDRRHLIGSIAMARGGDDRNSASSQFYICLRPLPELDGDYVVFGRVARGLSVLSSIAVGDVIERVDIVESP
ncbi:peptidylprolyl isomerase [Candidatus Poribacteria bacterium]|nr:peptidylprolyl isomerase [Candidatus Poribacteria bacterium]